MRFDAPVAMGNTDDTSTSSISAPRGSRAAAELPRMVRPRLTYHAYKPFSAASSRH
jgi:hypothetical protein